MIDEAALCAHGYIASPASKGGRGVLGHVLIEEVSKDDTTLKFKSKPYNLVIAFVVSAKFALRTSKAIFLVCSQVGLAGKNIVAAVAMEVE